MLAAPEKDLPKKLRKDLPHSPSEQVSPAENPSISVSVILNSAVNCLVAAALLIVSIPVVLVAAIFVKLTSKGPAFFKQERVGRGGRVFTIIKLRTMHHECERESGPQWSTAGDKRITRIGLILRRTHIDELPQLWNVLKLEMSLVGPRPERPEFVDVLAEKIPHYRDRLRVHPGMTGLAQVQLPPDTDLQSVRRKLACDLFYVHHKSLFLDLKILLATAAYLAAIPFSWTKTLLQIPSGETVESTYRQWGLPSKHRPNLQPASSWVM